MVSKGRLQARLIYLLFTVTLLPYLKYVPQPVAYAVAAGMIVTISLLMLVLSSAKDFEVIQKLISSSPHFWAFVFLLLGSQYLVVLSSGLSSWGFVKTIGYILVLTCTYVVLAPRILSSGKMTWRFVARLGGVLSLFGVIVSIRGSVALLGLSWSARWRIPVVGVLQTTSIFEDSNYFSVVTFVGFMASLYLLTSEKRVWPKLSASVLATLNAFGAFLSYSRATYLALTISIVVWGLLDTNVRKKAVILLSAALIAIGGTPLIRTMPTLRTFVQLEKGLSGRERVFPAAITAIAERPLFGWGVGNVKYAIQKNIGNWTNARESFVDHLIQRGAGNRWASAHNGFLDFFVMTGIPGGLMYVWFILISARRLFVTRNHTTESRFLLSSIAGMVIISQFTTHTVGGTSFGSFLFTALLGMANCWPVQMRRLRG